MVEFAVNTHRLDPYKSFKFRVVLDGKSVPGVSKVSSLARRTEPILHRSGGSVSSMTKAPGLTTFDPIRLERGVTHDQTFEDWANLAFNVRGDAEMSLRKFRKDMVIELLNQQATVVLRYLVYRCWVVEYQALSELDANANGVAIESIVLEHEGFERDSGVAEPTET